MASLDPSLRGWYLLTRMVGVVSLGVFAVVSSRYYRDLGRPRNWLIVTVGTLSYQASLAIEIAKDFFDLPDAVYRLTGLLALGGACIMAVSLVPVLGKAIAAMHVDPLTGLYNRSHFEEAIKREWIRSSRLGTPFSVVLIDLDGFKSVNDTHGHQAGDIVLRHIARLISGHIREYDVAARWGGDEIALLLPGVDAAQAVPLVQGLRDLTYEYAHAGTKVGMSAGYATFPDDSKSVVGLIRIADSRLYEEKGAKRA